MSINQEVYSYLESVDIKNRSQIFKEKEWTDKDSLEDFLNWFFYGSPSIGKVPFLNTVTKTSFNDNKNALTITWYNKPPFQVQLIIAEPGLIIPEHVHPNMDSFEVFVGGQINFFKNGVLETIDYNSLKLNENDYSPNRGNYLRVRPNDLHGGLFGESGGVFFSVQKWLNGVEPKDVTADWIGISYSSEHKSRITTGDSVLVDEPLEEHSYKSTP